MKKLQQIRRARKKGKPTLNTPDLQKRILARGRKNRPAGVTGLARAQSILQRGKTAKGLAVLNQLAQTATTNKRKAKITALIGDSEFRQAHYPEALQAYQSASVKAANHIREWLRPNIGELVCFLQLADMESAAVKARFIWQKAQALHQAFLATQGNAAAMIRANGKFIVAQRPHRASVVASRLGQLFLHEGEIGLAQEFFDHAVAVNPHGAARSRQGLAEMALRAGDYAEAERKAREALLVGRYQSKTIGVWPVLIAARARLGLEPLDSGLKTALFGISKGGVRSRAVLSVIAELRKQSAVGWEALANQWLAQQATQYPLIAVELRKLLLSSSRTQNLPTGTLTKALLSQPRALSFKEFIAVAKEQIRQETLQGQSSSTSALSSQGVVQFGPKTIGKINHALAFSLLEAGHSAAAAPLLVSNFQTLSQSQPQWAKSGSALARIEKDSGDFMAAASRYHQIAGSSSVPIEFRLRCKILEIRALLDGPDLSQVTQEINWLTQEINKIQDWRILLDMGRQCSFSPQTRPLMLLISESAADICDQEMAKTQNPTAYLNILFQLSRRQLFDFGRSDLVISRWSALDTAKKNWLWSENTIFWEYLGFVIEAYARFVNSAKVAALCKEYSEDVATPKEGLPYLLIPKINWLARIGQYSATLELSSWLTNHVPGHRRCAWAYYWQSVNAFAKGNKASANMFAGGLIAAQKRSLGTLEELDLDCRSRLIALDLSVDNLKAENPTIDSRIIEEALVAIKIHIREFQAL